MKLTFKIDLSAEGGPFPHVEAGLSVPSRESFQEKLVMAGWHGEMGWHLSLKLLAYLLFMEDRPRIEEGIGWHYKPDLVKLDESGQVDLWVDCGNIAVRKIDRVATKVGRDGRFFILKRHRSEARIFDRSLEGKIKRRQRLVVLAFDDDFVDRLTEVLDGTNQLRAHRTHRRIELGLNNRHGRHELSSEVYRF